MTKSFVMCCVLGVISFGAIGCGDSTSAPSEVVDTAEQTLDGKVEIKSLLTTTAENGQVGSGVAGIRNGLEALKSSDDALATSLLSDLDKLEAADNAGNQAQVKSIAAGMAKKL
jgi:hypothetical protein